MSIFRRGPRRPKLGPHTLSMRLADGPKVWVTPTARGRPAVHMGMSLFNMTCAGALTEDEARKVAKALLDGLEQSRVLIARYSD